MTKSSLLLSTHSGVLSYMYQFVAVAAFAGDNHPNWQSQLYQSGTNDSTPLPVSTERSRASIAHVTYGDQRDAVESSFNWQSELYQSGTNDSTPLPVSTERSELSSVNVAYDDHPDAVDNSLSRRSSSDQSGTIDNRPLPVSTESTEGSSVSVVYEDQRENRTLQLSPDTDPTKGNITGESSGIPNYFVDKQHCQDTVFQFSSRVGIVNDLVTIRPGLHSYRTDCRWKIVVPQGLYVFGDVEFLSGRRGNRVVYLDPNKRLHSYDSTGPEQSASWDQLDYLAVYGCVWLETNVLPTFASAGNTLYFATTNTHPYRTRFPDLKIRFHATEISFRSSLPVEHSSTLSGYISSPGYNSRRGYPPGVDARQTLSPPADHVTMISFPRLEIGFTESGYVMCPVYYQSEPNEYDTDDGYYNYYGNDDSYRYSYDSAESNFEGDYLKLFSVNSGSPTPLHVFCGKLVVPAEVYTDVLEIHFHSHDHRKCSLEAFTGFKMLFSFHPVFERPVKLESGLFDCSVPYYSSFRQHVDCNLRQECRGSEDEGSHCPFSSQACNGSVAVRDKCYTYFSDTSLTWLDAQQMCESKGQTLATMKSAEEWNAFYSIFEISPYRNSCAYV
ncbi:hypothetical protein BaRGS_00022626, partial [Batillaria attramentaria]